MGYWYIVTQILVDWLSDQRRVIYCEIRAGWDWEDAAQAVQGVVRLAQSVAYPVVLICSVPMDVSIPPDGFAEYSQHALQTHAQLGLPAVVYVLPNRALLPLWQASIDLYASPHVEYHFANTLDEALSIAERFLS